MVPMTWTMVVGNRSGLPAWGRNSVRGFLIGVQGQTWPGISAHASVMLVVGKQADSAKATGRRQAAVRRERMSVKPLAAALTRPLRRRMAQSPPRCLLARCLRLDVYWRWRV